MEPQVQHLVRLVDDLLDVSHIMRGKIVLREERVEIATTVARAVETVQSLIDSQRHELSIRLTRESLALDADPIRLTQVIVNLLTNAAKYTEPCGPLEVEAYRDGENAVLVVRDTGIGIPPETLPCIFDLFVRVDHAAVRSQGGLGIGLTLVRNLVELHNGTIEARSDGPAKGSEFIVRLPLGTLLRLQGHGGVAALEIANQFLPDAVLLDIGMPGMDGFEVATRLREQPAMRHAVLVALTERLDQMPVKSRFRAAPPVLLLAPRHETIAGRSRRAGIGDLTNIKGLSFGYANRRSAGVVSQCGKVRQVHFHRL